MKSVQFFSDSNSKVSGFRSPSKLLRQHDGAVNIGMDEHNCLNRDEPTITSRSTSFVNFSKENCSAIYFPSFDDKITTMCVDFLSRKLLSFENRRREYISFFSFFLNIFTIFHVLPTMRDQLYGLVSNCSIIPSLRFGFAFLSSWNHSKVWEVCLRLKNCLHACSSGDYHTSYLPMCTCSPFNRYRILPVPLQQFSLFLPPRLLSGTTENKALSTRSLSPAKKEITFP